MQWPKRYIPLFGLLEDLSEVPDAIDKNGDLTLCQPQGFDDELWKEIVKVNEFLKLDWGFTPSVFRRYARAFDFLSLNTDKVCFKKFFAARRIQRAYLKAMYDPQFKMCCDRLIRECLCFNLKGMGT